MTIRNAFLLALLSLPLTCVLAQTFPSSPIVLTVPFVVGGGSDSVARTLAGAMGGALGQPINVENIPGAAGAVGIARTVMSNPDGYRILLGGAEVVREGGERLSPVALIGTSPTVIAVRQDFSGQIKGQRTTLGGFSARYVDGLVLRQLSRSTSIRMQPYRGIAPAISDLSAGKLDLFVGDYSSVKSQVEAAQMKVIAASSQPPNAANPIPSFTAAGVQPLRGEAFFGLYAPRGTPQAVINKLSDALVVALRNDEVSRGLASLGVLVRPGNAESLRSAMALIAASIPNPCKIKSECEKDPECNPPECPSN